MEESNCTSQRGQSSAAFWAQGILGSRAGWGVSSTLYPLSSTKGNCFSRFFFFFLKCKDCLTSHTIQVQTIIDINVHNFLMMKTIRQSLSFYQWMGACELILMPIKKSKTFFSPYSQIQYQNERIGKRNSKKRFSFNLYQYRQGCLGSHFASWIYYVTFNVSKERGREYG